MPPEYILIEEVPPPDVYCRLRADAGMSPRSEEAAARGLPNTLFAVVARCEGRIVGMGRVVGDGGCCFVVTDMAVHPEHQRRGVGKAIFARIVAWLQANVPSGSHISLLADGEAHRLYAQFGFRPSAPASIGMELSLP